MLLSKKKMFLFFKVSKAASTTVEQALPLENCRNNEALRDFWKNFSNAYGIESGYNHPSVASHINMRVIKHHDILPDSVLSKLTKFCFVRNPWDRMVSEYHARGAQEPFEDFIRAIPEMVNSLYQEQFYTDFDHYSKVEHFVPQYDYVYDAEGNKILDFVGKFENLKEDFDEIYNKVYGEQCSINAVANKINRSNHEHYSKYYNEETKGIIAQAYAKDIEAFGYSFEEPAKGWTETERL